MAMHNLDADQIGRIIEYLPIRDGLRLLSIDQAHRLLMLTPRVWKPIYHSLWKCDWKVLPSVYGWKEGFRRSMQSQANWKHGIASASVHHLQGLMERSGRGTVTVAAGGEGRRIETRSSSSSLFKSQEARGLAPIQALQLRLVNSKAVGTAQLLVAGRGESLHISKHVDDQQGNSSIGNEGKTSILNDQWQEVCTIKGAHKGMIHAIKTNNEGVITAGADRSVKIYDFNKNESYAFADQHASPIWGLDVSLDHHLIATSGFRWTQLWDTRTGKPPLRIETAHQSWIRTLELVPCKNLLITGSKDGKATVWDLRKGMKSGDGLMTLGHETKEEVRDLQVCAGHTLVTASHDGFVRWWDLLTGDMEELVSTGHQPVECVQACDKRVVSVDWCGEVSCVINQTAIERLDAVLYGDDHLAAAIADESKEGMRQSPSFRNTYRLRTTVRKPSPSNVKGVLAETIGVEKCNINGSSPHKGPTLEAPQVLSMSYDDQRLVLGYNDGSLLQLSFDKAAYKEESTGDERCPDSYRRPYWVK